MTEPPRRPRRRPARLARVEVYARELAGALRLADWTITVSAESAGRDAYASIDTDPGKVAVLCLGPPFWRATPEVQRATIVHELAHCVFAPMALTLQQLGAMLPDGRGRALEVSLLDVEHEVIGWLEHVLSPSLPLPPAFGVRR